MPGCSTVKHGFHLTKNVVFPTAYDGHFTYMHKKFLQNTPKNSETQNGNKSTFKD